METNSYIPFIITIIFLVFVLGAIMITIFIWSERSRKKDDEKMASFMRFAHIESRKNTRETQLRIEEIHKATDRTLVENHKEATRIIETIQKENSLFLRMIFERVDRPPNENNA